MEDILPEIVRRKSGRIFSPKPVEEDILRRALLAARWAPSSGNQQPWRWVITTQGEPRNALNDALSRGNAWAKKAPVLVALISHPDLDHLLDGRAYYLFDCGLSAMSFILECVHNGLIAHPMAGFDEQKAREALGVPPDYRIIVLIAAGYPGDPQKDTDEETRQKESRPRSRFPAHITVFRHRWGTSWKE